MTDYRDLIEDAFERGAQDAFAELPPLFCWRGSVAIPAAEHAASLAADWPQDQRAAYLRGYAEERASR